MGNLSHSSGRMLQTCKLVNGQILAQACYRIAEAGTAQLMWRKEDINGWVFCVLSQQPWQSQCAQARECNTLMGMQGQGLTRWICQKRIAEALVANRLRSPAGQSQ